MHSMKNHIKVLIYKIWFRKTVLLAALVATLIVLHQLLYRPQLRHQSRHLAMLYLFWVPQVWITSHLLLILTVNIFCFSWIIIFIVQEILTKIWILNMAMVQMLIKVVEQLCITSSGTLVATDLGIARWNWKIFAGYLFIFLGK